MNIIFCNIAWMKKYEGITDYDKPQNGGSYIGETGDAHESFNFQDYNEKCYGFVRLNGKLNLNKYYKEVKRTDSFINDILVVWVATNKRNETRIVGWYKNAKVFREGQYRHCFYDESNAFEYRIEAFSKDCYLIPEKNRGFEVARASVEGTGKGFGQSNIWYADSEYAKKNVVPNVIEYIDNYSGKYENKIYDNKIINAKIEDNSCSNDYYSLFNEGEKYYKNGIFQEAIKYFNSAKSIKETEEVDTYIAYILFDFNLFDKVIEMYKYMIEKYGENIDVLDNLVYALQLSANYKESIKYSERVIEILDNSSESTELKLKYLGMLFDINIYYRNESNCKEIMNRVASYDNKSHNRSLEEDINQMKIILENEFSDII